MRARPVAALQLKELGQAAQTGPASAQQQEPLLWHGQGAGGVGCCCAAQRMSLLAARRHPPHTELHVSLAAGGQAC